MTHSGLHNVFDLFLDLSIQNVIMLVWKPQVFLNLSVNDRLFRQSNELNLLESFLEGVERPAWLSEYEGELDAAIASLRGKTQSE